MDVPHFSFPHLRAAAFMTSNLAEA